MGKNTLDDPHSATRAQKCHIPPISGERMGWCFLHRFRPDSPDKTLRSNGHGEEELRGVEATGPEILGESWGRLGSSLGTPVRLE